MKTNLNIQLNGSFDDYSKKPCLGIISTRQSTPYSEKILKQILNTYLDKFTFACSYVFYKKYKRVFKDAGKLSVIIASRDYFKSSEPLSEINYVFDGNISQKANYLILDMLLVSICQKIVILESTRESKNIEKLSLYAASIGVDVYCVPGNIDSPYSQGTNKLIYEGCIPLYSIELLKV